MPMSKQNKREDKDVADVGTIWRIPADVIGEAMEAADQALKEEARLKEEKELKRERMEKAEREGHEMTEENELLAKFAEVLAEFPDKAEAKRAIDRFSLLLRIRRMEAVNTAEAGLLLGITAGRVRALVSDGKLPHYKIGQRVYFKKSEITQIPAGAVRVPTNEETEAEAVNYSLFKNFTKH